MMVAMMKVTEMVISANSSPRKRCTRNTTKPIAVPSTAASAAAAGSVHKYGIPSLIANVAAA